MSQTWVLWYLASALTGHPLGALLVLLVLGWLSDRFSFRLLPDPLRAFGRLRRAGELRRILAMNPNDRRARFELADLILTRRPREAAELARRNVEAGDEDVRTVFLLGTALARSGEHEQAEHVLAHARDREPTFRVGEIDLELGRLRLSRRDFQGAREALERLVAARPGSVEGRWHLARALEGLGDRDGGRRTRAEGWREYKTLPRFKRREERRFAARLRPMRAGLVLAAAIVCAVAVVVLAVGQ